MYQGGVQPTCDTVDGGLGSEIRYEPLLYLGMDSIKPLVNNGRTKTTNLNSPNM